MEPGSWKLSVEFWPSDDSVQGPEPVSISLCGKASGKTREGEQILVDLCYLYSSLVATGQMVGPPLNSFNRLMGSVNELLQRAIDPAGVP
jgi:hypothetical protein